MAIANSLRDVFRCRCALIDAVLVLIIIAIIHSPFTHKAAKYYPFQSKTPVYG
jgi:hypothetical protein